MSFRDQKSSLKGLLCQRFIKVPLNAVAYAWFFSFGGGEECPRHPVPNKGAVENLKTVAEIVKFITSVGERVIYLTLPEKHSKCLTATVFPSCSIYSTTCI